MSLSFFYFGNISRNLSLLIFNAVVLDFDVLKHILYQSNTFIFINKMTHNEKRTHWVKEGAIGLGTGILFGVTNVVVGHVRFCFLN